MTLLVKSFIGFLFVGTLGGGLAFGGYEFNKRALGGNNFQSPKEDSFPEKLEFPWEYFLVVNKNKKECGRFVIQSESESGEGRVGDCNTTWSKSISEQHKEGSEIGWWIVGKKDSVNQLLQGWESFKSDLEHENIGKRWNTKDGISSLKKDSKCEIKEEQERVEIFCK